MSLQHATFARYHGKAVVILTWGQNTCVVRYVGGDLGFMVNTLELTEF